MKPVFKKGDWYEEATDDRANSKSRPQIIAERGRRGAGLGRLALAYRMDVDCPGPVIAPAERRLPSPDAVKLALADAYRTASAVTAGKNAVGASS